MTPKLLNKKQQIFINEYLQCWNASEAARRAGYTGKPNVIGARLLANVSIKAAIEKRLSDSAMSANEVLGRLADQARGSMADFLNIESNSIDLNKADKLDRLHLIKKFSHTIGKETENFTIELYDAQSALIQIGRKHGLFTDKHDLTSGGKELRALTELSDDDLARIATGSGEGTPEA